MSSIPHIENESEDLFAKPPQPTEMKRVSKEADDSELAAAAALTNLVRTKSTSPTSLADSEDFHVPERLTKSGRKRAVPFPIKLMKALSKKENSHILCWTPSGKAFHILKPKAFAVEILPTFFKTAKYSSFTRKLHRWGFSRHYRGEDSGAFYHELFQRGRIDLAEQMACSAEPPSKEDDFAEEPKAKRARTEPQPQEPTLVTETQSQPRQISVQQQNQPFMDPLYRQQLARSAIQEQPSIDQLDAAIEIEVRRRLQLAMLQRQLALGFAMQGPSPSLLLQNALLRQQQNAQNGLLAHKLKAPEHKSQSPNVGPSGLPPTNIQGARTA